MVAGKGIFGNCCYPASPPAVMGIDVNFYKNPHCKNFGVPADLIKFQRKKGALATTPGTAYGLVGVGAHKNGEHKMLAVLVIKKNRYLLQD
jgi:hypothetical protein